MLKKFSVLSLLVFTAGVCVTAGIATWLLRPLPAAVAQTTPQPDSKAVNPYAQIDVRAGVWNDGQAAIWDLNLIDHFRLFGAMERARGWAPDQPIKFMHTVHVQENKIECQYCHWTVAKSPYAAIPEMQTCMGCHTLIGGSNDEYKAEIQKLRDYYQKNQPIPWVKVHVMPDHVKFNHKRHVKAGVACQECHGQIPAMDKVERVSSMKMGWCVTCHRERGTSIDCMTCHH
jgi:hypothetical protein